MEDLYNGLRRTGQTLETDATLRLPKRPLGNSNPNPNAFENFGSTLRVAPSSSQTEPKSKPKSQRSVSRESTRPITIKKPQTISIKKPLSDFLDSEDELDFLSSSQADPDDYKPSRKASSSQPGKCADGNGKNHDNDPKSLSKSQVLAKLKFTKTKSAKDNATIPSSRALKTQPDLKENSQDFGSWVNDVKKKGAATGEYSGDDDIMEISSPLHIKSSNQRLSPPQSKSKQPNHHRLPDASLPARPRPRPLPLPRPACKPNAKPDSIFVDGHELIPLGRAKKTTVTKGKNPSRSPSLSILTPKKKPLPKPRNKVNPLSFEEPRELSMFPMPSPQSNKNDVGSSQPKGKSKAKPFPLDEDDEDEADEESDRDEGERTPKDKGRQKQLSSSPQTFPMDMISPLGGKKIQKKLPMVKIGPPSFKASRKLKAFPMPSPQTSDKTKIRATLQSKGKNKAQPFPEEGLSKQQKRMSEDRSDDEQQAKKKRRSSLSPSQYSFEDEGDSLTISPDIDPRTLCPYCDTLLPSSPSTLLINILAATRKKSTRDPRPSNPLGLKAPLAIFIVVCQRHKFESQILPEAERKGWPKTIQWTKLGARVEGMKDELRALIEDPGGEHGNVDVDEDIDEVERLFRNDSDGTGPKARSIFWTEVMDEVKKKGSRAVVGVQGQFANFEKTQPGYYGEQGSVIIHQTLFDMFPPASFDPSRILPLTSNEFILRILVPEVALRLIMEDRDLEGNDGMHQALIVLRESSTYGVAMFPEDGGEGSTGRKRRDDALWVGDKIVMERARKRRKELEEEEEQEEREETRRIAEIEAGVETQVKKMDGGKKRKRKQREEQQVEEQPTVERPRPRPRPVAKASSSMSILPLSDDEELPQLQKPYAITRAHSKERSDSTMGFYDGDEDDVDFLDSIKTPVRKDSRSDDEKTPKPGPSLLPLVGGSNDNIKPLMIARTRLSRKNDAESKFGEADMPRQLRSDERAPSLRAIRVEDTTTDTEVESPNNYNWLLNDSSQSSMEGKSTSRRRH